MSSPTVGLSDRQRRILAFIVAYTREHDFPPSIRDICEQVGISSTSVVNYNLERLEALDLLRRTRDVSRGLSLNRQRMVEMGLLSDDGEVVQQLATRAGRAGNRSRTNGRTEVRQFRVPVLGKIAAGNPIRVTPEDASTADEWVDLVEGFLGSQDRLFALKVQGDSMVDAGVLDGDIVILRHQQTADDGDMVAAWIQGDEETTLKYLYREGHNVRLKPASPNPDNKPIIRPADKVLINGKVVSVIRKL